MNTDAPRIALAGRLTLAAADTPDAPPRIGGVLATYGPTSAPSLYGQRVQLAEGSVTLPEVGVPLLREHDAGAAAAGVLTAMTRDGADLLGTFDLLDTSAGRDTLAELRAGVRTDLSVGLAVLESEDLADGSLLVLAAELVEVSQVLRGAMPGARVTSIAATATPEVPTMTDPTIEATPVTAPPAETEARPAPLALTTADRPRPTPTAGEYLYAYLNRHAAPERFAALAAPHTFIGDVPGIVPKPIVGDVLSARPSDRPIFDRLGARVGPVGASFIRPVISDPVLDAAAAAEKSDVTDQLKVTGTEITYTFIKRAVNLSAEALSATSPEVLGVAAADLARAYLRGTEKVAAAALGTADATASPVANLSALYSAAAAQYAATGRLPDTLFLSPGAWAVMAPAIPNVGPMNGVGTNAGAGEFGIDLAGLNVIVSWAITGTVGYLTSTDTVESWERSRITMQADEPTILGVALGIGGAVAVSAPIAGSVTACEFASFTPTTAPAARR